MQRVVIEIHADAPPKPAEGAPCNGCGLCCAWQPCPVGAWVSGRRTGACAALEWHADGGRYRCGMVVAPERHVRWLPSIAAPLVRRAVLRWIAAARGCDFSADQAG